MTAIYRNNFVFIADRYEEWQGGRCISSDDLDVTITAEVKDDKIHFELSTVGSLRILKSFDFEILDYHGSVLPDRVQYLHNTQDFNPVFPIVCNIFYQDDNIDYVRFAMTNPDRIIEFYGYMDELGQPSIGRSPQSITPAVTADSIVSELQSYGMLNKEAIMERVVNLYNNNCSVATVEEAYAVLESLKLFAKVYDLEVKEMEEKGMDYSLFMPKILMFIALANYKIGNFNQAYCVAKQGLDAVDNAEKKSIFTGFPRSMYGADNMEEVIRLIENNFFDDVFDSDNYWEIEPNNVITERFMALTEQFNSHRINRDYILSTINFYDDVRAQLVYAYIQGNKLAMHLIMMVHEFACPLFYAWEYFGFGKMSDLWKEDLAIETYNKYKSQNVLEESRKSLNAITNGIFPFRTFDKDGKVLESTKNILKALIKDIEENI